MHESQWGSLAAARSLLEAVFLLQVTRESISGTSSHVCVSERAIQSKVCMIKSLSP